MGGVKPLKVIRKMNQHLPHCGFQMGKGLPGIGVFQAERAARVSGNHIIAKRTAENAPGKDHAFMGVDPARSLFHSHLRSYAQRTDGCEQLRQVLLLSLLKGEFHPLPGHLNKIRSKSIGTVTEGVPVHICVCTVVHKVHKAGL